MHYLTKPDESGHGKVTYPASRPAKGGAGGSLYPVSEPRLTMKQMSSILPGTEEFSTPVYGTVFGRRSEVVHRLTPGDSLILVPDPPGADPPTVWVHARGGDVVGHLSPDVNSWLAPSMLDGSCYRGEVVAVRGDDVASWKRLVIAVRRVRSAAKSA